MMRVYIPIEMEQLRTDGNTLTVLFSLLVEENTALVAEVTVIGLQANGARGLYWKAIGEICRRPGQNVQVILQKVLVDEKTDASWQCQFALNAAENRVKIKVAGGAGQKILWNAYISLQKFRRGQV
jgi:hypothetical protein